MPDKARILLRRYLTIATDTKEEDLTHPEDIAHFAKHDREEEEAERLEERMKQAVLVENIPLKFRRDPPAAS